MMDTRKLTLLFIVAVMWSCVTASDYQSDTKPPSYAESAIPDNNNAASAPCAEAVPSNPKQILPYSATLRENALTTSLANPQSKGEILIHKPAAIVVKRPPTKIVVNHPNLVVKPAPVIFHKPPPVVIRKVIYRNYPKQVKVEPVYVNVVKSAPTKYYLHDRQQKEVSYTTPSSNYDASNYSYAGNEEASKTQYSGDDASSIPSNYDNADYNGQSAHAEENHNYGVPPAGYQLLQDGALSGLPNY